MLLLQKCSANSNNIPIWTLNCVIFSDQMHRCMRMTSEGTLVTRCSLIIPQLVNKTPFVILKLGCELQTKGSLPIITVHVLYSTVPNLSQNQYRKQNTKRIKFFVVLAQFFILHRAGLSSGHTRKLIVTVGILHIEQKHRTFNPQCLV